MVHAVHDGVQSLYTGVGRIAQNICWTFEEAVKGTLGGNDAALHLITVAYPRAGSAFREDILNQSLEIVRRSGGTLSETQTPVWASSANEVWGGPERWRLAGEQAADRVREIAVDYERVIVFAHDIMFASMLPALARGSTLSHVKAVWVPHSTARIHRYGEIDDERELIELEAADAIQAGSGSFAGAVGNFMAKHLHTEYGIPRDRIVLFRNGIVRTAPVYPRLSPSQAETILAAAGVPIGPPLVLFFGRCIPHKGVDLVLDAFARQTSPAHLLLIAPPETGSREYVAEMANRLDEIGNRATGVLRFDTLLPFAALSYPRTATVVIPSRADPCPLTVMEAKLYAQGRAFVILMSDVDGLAEQSVLDSTEVVKLNTFDLAEAIERAVSTPLAERRRVAKAAHDSLDAWDFARNHKAGLVTLLRHLR